MSTINVRIEEKTKIAASKLLAAMGLDLSTGVKLFLHQVVTEKGLPFRPTKVPLVPRAQLDAEFEETIKRKGYQRGRDVLKGL